MSDSLDDALKAFTTVLAHVYASINWRKIKVKQPHDMWNHRVRAAMASATVDQAVSRLANFFGIQSLPTSAILLLDRVRPHANLVLDVVAREHITWAMLVVIEAQSLRRKPKAQLTLEHTEESNENGADSENTRAD